MKYSDAMKIIQDFYYNGEQTEDEPMFEEACHVLIDDYGSKDALIDLGGYYYGKKLYDLALKYYSIAADRKVPYGCIGLGYIYYYGRTGEKDYQKAYHYFSKAIEFLTGENPADSLLWRSDKEIRFEDPQQYNDYINAVYKIADMYRSGHYVTKDYDHYTNLIRHLYALITRKDVMDIADYYLPEIELRMAEIEMNSDVFETGLTKEKALELLLDAKAEFGMRLYSNPFFGDFSNMKNVIRKIYSLTDFDEEDMDLYDLYYVLQKPVIVTFMANKGTHTIIAEKEGMGIVVSLDGKWFRSVDDMMMKGRIEGEPVPIINVDCYDFTITEGHNNE